METAKTWQRLNVSIADSTAWVIGLFTIGFVSVVTAVLNANPFFFTAHGILSWQVALILLGLLFIAFIVVGVVLWLVKKGLGPKALDIAASALVFIVGFFVVFNIVGRVLDGNTVIAVVAGALAGAGLAYVSRRFAFGRVLLGIGVVVALGPLVISGFGSSSGSEPSSVAFSENPNPPSVLWVIADELQYSALQDPAGNVRASYPNLKALQQDSTTYTRAYGLANATHLALPAMFHGVSNAEAWWGEDYSAFRAGGGVLSWVNSKYNVVADSLYFRSEPGTTSPWVDLEKSKSGQSQSQGTLKDTQILLADIGAISAQAGLAPQLSGPFPVINDRWYDFWSLVPETTISSSGANLVGALIESETPTFALWHSMLTHLPYVRDFQGALLNTSNLGNEGNGLRSTDLKPLNRRLYAAATIDFDRQVGWVLQQLRDSGKYDSTMIIVTADHGRSFTQNSTWRVGDSIEERWADVAHVPLLVKYPQQGQPEFISAPRSTSQITPTVLDVVGANVTVPFDMAPPLTQDLPGLPRAWFDLGDGSSVTEELPAYEVVETWDPSDFVPATESAPFFVGLDPTLVGAPVPADWKMIAEEPAIVNDLSSNQVVLQVTRPLGACTDGERFGLVSSGGTVIGDLVWEKTQGSEGGVIRGWGVLPKIESGNYQIWCGV